MCCVTACKFLPSAEVLVSFSLLCFRAGSIRTCWGAMKLQCDVEVVSRLLPTFGVKSRGRGTRAVLSIGKHLDKTSRRSGIYMMVCTAKDRAGSKYKVGFNLFFFFQTPLLFCCSFSSGITTVFLSYAFDIFYILSLLDQKN